MKKVVLLGDSIRLYGYGPRMKDALGDGYEIWQPEDNCRFASYTLRMLFDYAENLKGADVIHFNCGLWDVTRLFSDGGTFTPIGEYGATLERLAKLLLKITPNVIFSTTTPVYPDYVYNANTDIEAFNSVAVAVLKPLGVKINDLYGPVAADLDANLAEDKLHLSEKGGIMCAELVANAIKKMTE